MPATPFAGTRGSNNFVTNQRPEHWRAAIQYLYPNGSAPLTAILGQAKGESVDDPKFHWWTQVLPTQRAAVTGVFTSTTFSTANVYASGAALGATLYIRMAEADAKNFRAGHQVLLRDSSNYTVDVNARVDEAPTLNGASSYLKTILLEADDNGVGNDLSDCDTALIIGNINAENATMPAAIAWDPEEFWNYTQIFRTPLKMSRTAMKTRLRTEDQRKKAKREALEIHTMEIEKALLFGIKTQTTAADGMPRRTTEGIFQSIRGNVPGNVRDYVVDGSTAWTSGGEAWLEEVLEILFRYGDSEKLCLAGSGAVLGINALAKSGAQITINPGATKYGLKVTEWITPFGTIMIKTHPLFSHEPTNRNTMLILEPNRLKWRYIDDTFYKADESDRKNTNNSRDGKEEEWLTEAGLEFHLPQTGGILHNVGVDAS